MTNRKLNHIRVLGLALANNTSKLDPFPDTPRINKFERMLLRAVLTKNGTTRAEVPKKTLHVSGLRGVSQTHTQRRKEMLQSCHRSRKRSAGS